MRRALVVLASGVLAALAFAGLAEPAAGAGPQGPWLPFTRISDSQSGSSSPQIAVAPDGTATAVWSRSSGAIQTATRPPGGQFDTATNLAGSGTEAEEPQIAVGSDGTVTLAWRRVTEANSVVVSAATRPPGGSFGTPVDISAPADRLPNGFDPYYGLGMVVADDGTATVVWLHRDELSNRTVEAVTRLPGGSFGAPAAISSVGLTEAPKIAIADDGTTTVVWSRRDNIADSMTVVQASTRPPNGSFGMPIDLSGETGELLDSPSIAVANDGTTTVAWSRMDNNGPGLPPSAIESVTRPPGGSFGPVVEIPGSRPQGGVPQIAVSPDGTATVVWGWSNSEATVYAINASTRPPGGSFSPPVNISTAGQVFGGPRIVAASDGTVTVISSRTDGPNTVYASTRPPEGSFGPQVNISGVVGNTDTGGYRMAIAPDGVVTVVWWRTNQTKPYDLRVETASTESPRFTLTTERAGSGTGRVFSDPGGIDCGTSCSAEFVSYADVTLSAAAEPNSRFTGWSGAGCSGTGVCRVKMGSDAQVTATFDTEVVPPVPTAKIDKVTVVGPAKLRKGKKGIYSVKVTNSGGADATGLRLRVIGKGIERASPIGGIAAQESRTVKVALRPKKLGRIRTLFKVTSDNAGGKSVAKTITVKKWIEKRGPYTFRSGQRRRNNWGTAGESTARTHVRR